MAEKPFGGTPYTNYTNRRPVTSVYKLDSDGIKANFAAVADGTAIEDNAVTTRTLSQEVLDLLAYGIRGSVATYDDLPDPETLDPGTVYAVKEFDDPHLAGLYAVVEAGGSPEENMWQLILRSVSDHSALDNLAFASAGHTGFAPAISAQSGSPTKDDDEVGTAGNGVFLQTYLWLDSDAQAVWICVSPTTESAVWRKVETSPDWAVEFSASALAVPASDGATVEQDGDDWQAFFDMANTPEYVSGEFRIPSDAASTGSLNAIVESMADTDPEGDEFRWHLEVQAPGAADWEDVYSSDIEPDHEAREDNELTETWATLGFSPGDKVKWRLSAVAPATGDTYGDGISLYSIFFFGGRA